MPIIQIPHILIPNVTQHHISSHPHITAPRIFPSNPHIAQYLIPSSPLYPHVPQCPVPPYPPGGRDRGASSDWVLGAGRQRSTPTLWRHSRGDAIDPGCDVIALRLHAWPDAGRLSDFFRLAGLGILVLSRFNFGSVRFCCLSFWF